MAPAWLACLLRHALAPFGRRQQELVTLEEAAERLDLGAIDHQRRVRLDVCGNPLRIARPAQQTFVLQPANAVEAIDDGVLDCPAGRPVTRRPGIVEAQILAQGLEGQPSGHYQPLHSRKVARGRRSR